MTTLEPPPAARLTPPVASRPRPALAVRGLASFRVLSLTIVLLVIVTTAYAIIKVLQEAFTGSAFGDLIHFQGIGQDIGNTALVVSASTILSLVAGSLLAWANERTDARMGSITDTVPFLPFLMPPVAGAIGWALLLAPVGGYANSVIRLVLSEIGIHLSSGPFNVYSFYGLIFVYTIYLVPYVFLIVSAGIRNLDPQLEEQSRISGAGPARTFFRVILPGLSSSLASSALIVVWTGFAMFAIPQTIASPAKIGILSVDTVNAVTQDYPPNIGLGVMLSLVTMVFVGIAWYLQTQVRSRARHAVVGGRGSRQATRTRLGRAKVPVRVVMVLFMVIVTVLPAIALVLVSLTGYWSPQINWGHLSLAAFRATVLDNPATTSAIVDSFKIGLITATIAAAVAALASTVLVGRAWRGARVLDGVLKLPVIISPLVIALGFILGFAGAPFNVGGTITILVLAYFVLSVPQGTIATDAAASQVGRELREASELSGARGWRTFRKIYVPLMLPAIAISWALVFVRVLGDLEVSSLLAGTSNPTIGYQTMILYSQGSFSDVASLALVVLVTSAVVVALVLTLVRKLSRWNVVAPTSAIGDY